MVEMLLGPDTATEPVGPWCQPRRCAGQPVYPQWRWMGDLVQLRRNDHPDEIVSYRRQDLQALVTSVVELQLDLTESRR